MSGVAENIFATALVESVALSRKSSKFFIEHVICQLDECDQWQIDLCEAVMDVYRLANNIPTVVNHKGLNRISVVSCHGTGKTHVLALVLHVWNYCLYGLVVGTAPKQDQIKTRFMPRYRKIRRAAPDWYQSMQKVDLLRVTLKDEYGEWDTDYGYVGETASEPDNMQGYHDKPQLVLVDEASARTLDPIFPVIEGALTTAGSVSVSIGNPTRTQGEFYNSHNKDKFKDLFYKIHVKPEDSRHVDKKWMSDMAIKYGIDSPIYQVRCLGEFAKSEKNQLVYLDWLEEARGKELPEQGSFCRLRIAVDVSDGGEDESIVIAAHIYDDVIVLLKMYRYSFPAVESHILLSNEVDRIAKLHKYDISRGDDIVVDCLCVGSGTASRIFEKGYNTIYYKGSEVSGVDTKTYRNRRVQCYMILRDDYRDGKVYIADDFCSDKDWEDFTAQATSIKTRVGDLKTEDLEPKRLLLKSPDMTDTDVMLRTNQAPASAAQYEPELIGQMTESYDV